MRSLIQDKKKHLYVSTVIKKLSVIKLFNIRGWLYSPFCEAKLDSLHCSQADNGLHSDGGAEWLWPDSCALMGL